MDSSQRALQTNEKLFSNSKLFVFAILAENQKMFKLIARREYCSTCNVLSMDSSQQALQTNGNLFFKIQIRF